MVGAKLQQTPKNVYITYWHQTTLKLFNYLYYEHIWRLDATLWKAPVYLEVLFLLTNFTNKEISFLDPFCCKLLVC